MNSLMTRHGVLSLPYRQGQPFEGDVKACCVYIRNKTTPVEADALVDRSTGDMIENSPTLQRMIDMRNKGWTFTGGEWSGDIFFPHSYLSNATHRVAKMQRSMMFMKRVLEAFDEMEESNKKQKLLVHKEKDE